MTTTTNIRTLKDLISLPQDAPIVVSYGAGVDSTALLVLLNLIDITPDLILFADTGAEKPETLAYLDTMNAWLKKVGFPQITVVTRKTGPTTGYDTIVGNQTKNETLPSLAFHKHSCSVSWKIDPQDRYIKGANGGFARSHDDGTRTKSVVPGQVIKTWIWTPAAEAWNAGRKVTKLIGYDASEADLRRSNKAIKSDECFDYLFPLQMVGWDRADNMKAIIEADLPVPVKSACFFCPASKPWEIFWLAGTHPELFEKALEVEMIAMNGKHSRWGDRCKARPKAGQYPETFGIEWEKLVATPSKKWPTKAGTVGLGMGFAWGHFARQNGLVTKEGKVIEGRRAWALQKAAELNEGGNALDSRIDSRDARIAA